MVDGQLRALIIEDDRAWQEIVGEILQDMGFAVDRASTYEEAARCLRGTLYRLAIVDLSLQPDSHQNQDGLSVLQAIRAYTPGCTAVLLTGFATVELAVAALTAYGAYTCLRKETFRRSQFRDLIWEILSGQGSGQEPTALPRPGQARPLAEPPLVATTPFDNTGEGGLPLALVVENDPDWRGILTGLVEEAGYRAQPCQSYGEALGYLLRQDVVVAVVDLSLASSLAPDSNRDGYELLRRTRAAGVPAVVVSGLATTGDIERAYENYGISGYLEKQAFDRAGFLRTLAAAAPGAAGPVTAGGRPAPDWTAAGQLSSLTAREREVLALLVQGLTNKGIANALMISTNTVKRYLKSVFEKLEVNSRAAAVAKALSGDIK